MGLTGVEGKGCRYSGCKMCPDRAVSIFKTLMGSRFACRSGSDGGAAERRGLLALAELLFRELPLSQAAQISLFLRVEAEGDVIMSQLSGNKTGTLSSDTLRKSCAEKGVEGKAVSLCFKREERREGGKKIANVFYFLKEKK